MTLSAPSVCGYQGLEDAVLGTMISPGNRALLRLSKGRLEVLWEDNRDAGSDCGKVEWYIFMLNVDRADMAEAIVYDLVAGRSRGAAAACHTFGGKLATIINALAEEEGKKALGGPSLFSMD